MLGSPGKHAFLLEKALRKLAKLAICSSKAALGIDLKPCIDPLPQDHRFEDPAWAKWPYTLIYQDFLLTQQWWYNTTNDVESLSHAQERVV